MELAGLIADGLSVAVLIAIFHRLGRIGGLVDALQDRLNNLEAWRNSLGFPQT